MTPVQVRVGALSDVGKVRERNEDAHFAGSHVFAVADGLGGHRAGEVASDLALGSVRALDELPPRTAATKVAEAVRKGNRAVHDRAQKDDSLRGMGTTMTAVVISGDTAHIAHVGDSRCYLVRGDAITQLSNDHTLVARMVSEGRLTPEQAEAHPQRSVLTRALGADREVEVDETQITLMDGDRLLLCSDGLTGMLADDEIRRLVSSGSDLEEICQTLVDEANDRGGLDNITVVLVDVSGAPGATPAQAPRAHRPRSRRIPLRLFVWLAILAVLITGAYFGVRSWADRSYYIGLDHGHVAIYRGLPVTVGGIHLSHVEQPTDIKSSDVMAYFLPRLREGIRGTSLASARAKLTDIPLTTDAQKAHATPTPSPSASANTSPKASAT
ncbi:MAG: Stp1/IreP family PP2C-type Ser/Thr phosphatase [Actinomycetota bacterium]